MDITKKDFITLLEKVIINVSEEFKTKKDKKFDKVMGEFAKGKLKSGSGEKVKDRKQALAIAYSESGLDEETETEFNIDDLVEESSKWEQNLDIKKGALHKALGIPEGEKIPISLIDKKIKELQDKYDEKENMSAEDRKMLKRLVLAKTFKKQVSECTETDLTEGSPFKLGKGYTHFAIDKKTNKIINGWDYKGIDKEDLMSDKNSYFFSDLTDFIENTDTKKSDIKIVTKGALDKMGVDTSKAENWYISSGEQVTEMSEGIETITESYESDEIEKIIEPETEYGYSIVISNSGNGGNKTKYLKASKPQIEKIKQILSAGEVNEDLSITNNKSFLVKDLSGRSSKPYKLDLNHILKHFDLDELDDYSGESLGDYIETCEVGDKWRSGAIKIECLDVESIETITESDEPKEVKKYIALVQHDEGKIKFRTTGTSEENVKEKIMKAENCPEGAILSVKEIKD